MIIASFFIGAVAAIYVAWSLGTIQSLKQCSNKTIVDLFETNKSLLSTLSECALDRDKLLIVNGENQKELDCLRPFVKSLMVGHIQVIVSEQQILDIATAVYDKLKNDRPSTLN